MDSHFPFPSKSSRASGLGRRRSSVQAAPQPSQICDRCRGWLEFDDQKTGGTVAVSQNGQEHLSYETSSDWVEVGDGYWSLGGSSNKLHLSDMLPDLPGLAQSAEESGCEFCYFVRDAIVHTSKWDKGFRDIFDRHVECDMFFHWVWYAGDENDALEQGSLFAQLVVSLRTVRDAVYPVMVLGTDVFDKDNAVCQWLRLRHLTRHTGKWTDPAVMAWSKAKIDECIAQHPKCAGSGFRPRRLIDVQSQPAKLVIEDDIAQTPVYTALSYCWGSESDTVAQLKTDSQEVESMFTSGIPDDLIPAVVRDAILVTRALSIPYLWVDALCIRQDKDSNTDWEDHAPLMEQIYSNAYVTIGAIASASCTEGFCDNNVPEIIVNYQSRLRPKAAGLLRIRISQFVAWTLPLPKAMRLDMSLENIVNSKWNSRAWTYQEEHASTRFLAFCRTNLAFACSTGVYWEWLLNNRPRAFAVPSAGWFDWDYPDLVPTYQQWNKLFNAYCQRPEITYATDALPAISGLARLFALKAGMPETDYVAGLWRKDLLHNLMWFSPSGLDDGPPGLMELLRRLAFPEPYVAPSWSWACQRFYNTISLDVHLLWPAELKFRSLVSHIEASTILKGGGANPLGEITGGWLEVTGRLSYLCGKTLQRARPIHGMMRQGFSLATMPWTLTTSDDGTDGDQDDGQCSHQWYFRLDWCTGPFHEPQKCTTNLSMLLLGSCEVDLTKLTTLTYWDPCYDEGIYEDVLFGLLLYSFQPPTAPIGAKKFFRVGIFYSALTRSHSAERDMRVFEGCEEQTVMIL